MKQSDITALPNDPAVLKTHITRLASLVRSYEDAKRDRQIAEEAVAAGPAASFDIRLLDARNALEGLADGSEDFTDPLVRGKICRDVITLLKELYGYLPKT